ncbi:MAG: SpoIIE family protein phosphatase [Lentisphaerota bacterium]
MKLRTKISLVNVAVLLFAAVVTLYIAITDILEKSSLDIKQAEQEELIQVKMQIRDVTDLAYEVVESSYTDSLSVNALERNYGWLLREDVNATKTDISRELERKNVDADEYFRLAVKAAKDSVSNFNGQYIKVFFIAAGNDSSEKIVPYIKKAAANSSEGFVFNESRQNPVIAYFSKVANDKLVVVAEIGSRQIVDEAKERCKAVLRKFLYDEGRGYVFVNDLNSKVIMHPFTADTEGVDYSRLPEDKRKKHIPAMAELCKQKTKGYINYPAPKYDRDFNNNSQEVPKISYVKLFEPWGWIIGSGAYIDKIEKMAATRKYDKMEQVNDLILKVLISSVLITFGMILFSIFFAESLSKPIVKMIDKMKTVKLDELATSSVAPLKGSYEIKELGSIFNNMLHSINDGVKRIRETTSVKEKFESELNIARNIQMSLLPKTFPKLNENAEFDIYGAIKSARTVGGDMYDFFNIDDHNICFAIGDVSDKGVPSSLFMALTRTLLHSKAGKNLSAGQIVTDMNKSLCENNDASMFVSFFLGLLNLKTGKLNYCNAGHNLPFLIRKHSKIENLPVRHGIPIGVVDMEPYYDDTITLKPDDMLVLYTDGVIRGFNRRHELFGDVRLEKVLEKCAQMKPGECVDAVMDDVSDFTGNAEQEDDVAVLAVSYRGRAESRNKSASVHINQ